MPDSPGPMRVLITGAYGLIGNLVYARLNAQRGDAWPTLATLRLWPRLCRG